MLVVRRSPFDNVYREIDLPTWTQEKENLWRNGELIQDVAPELSLDEREFIMTGITPEQWDNAIAVPQGSEVKKAARKAKA